MDFFTLHFDGSCPKNPGDKASYGYTIHRSAELVKEGNGGLIGDRLDNNIAEFYACYKGLCYLKGLVNKATIISVKGDSALVIKILQKKWKLRKIRPFYEYAKRCLDLLTEIRKKGADVSCTWIPERRMAPVTIFRRKSARTTPNVYNSKILKSLRSKTAY